MLIIEGFAGKSLAVAEYLRGLESERALICGYDTIAVKSIDCRNLKTKVHLYEIDENWDIDTFIKKIGEKLGNLHRSIKFNDVIFYLNTTKDNIDKFKKFEDKFGFNVVLTVQTPRDENAKAREVKVYSC